PTLRHVEAAASQGTGGGLILPLLNHPFQKPPHKIEHFLLLHNLSGLESLKQAFPAKLAYRFVNQPHPIIGVSVKPFDEPASVNVRFPQDFWFLWIFRYRLQRFDNEK